QHTTLTLATAKLETLDGICGGDRAVGLSACAAACAEAARLRAELDRLRELSIARERELDLLDHELAEIDAAAPHGGEHDELLSLRERLRRLDALCSAAGAGADALAPDSHESPGAFQALAGAVARLQDLTGLDPQLDSL